MFSSELTKTYNNCNTSNCFAVCAAVVKVQSIYDVHTEGVRLRWTHVDGGSATQKIKIRAH